MSRAIDPDEKNQILCLFSCEGYGEAEIAVYKAHYDAFIGNNLNAKTNARSIFWMIFLQKIDRKPYSRDDIDNLKVVHVHDCECDQSVCMLCKEDFHSSCDECRYGKPFFPVRIRGSIRAKRIRSLGCSR